MPALLLVVLVAWATVAVWNSVKPLPPGVHVISLPARLADSQVDFLEDGAVLAREAEIIARAAQTIVLDQSPLPRSVAEQLLAAKHQRPGIRILLLTDPRNEAYGGTRAQTLGTLERAGIVVVRTRLERLRDSNPIYGSVWRLAVAWWSTPFDEAPRSPWLSAMRQRNGKADERQLLVADDGRGGWDSLVICGPAMAAGTRIPHVALAIRGHLARDMVSSEARIADWSAADDRLPDAPVPDGRGVGSIDARFLTDGAIDSALRDAVGLAAQGDSIDVVAHALDQRALVDRLLLAARRGVRLRVLLDTGVAATQAAAGELFHGGVDVRWRAVGQTPARFLLVRHRNDLWLDLGSADLTRRCLDDSNLEAGIELHMPARAAVARAASDFYAAAWSAAQPYADHADETAQTYWRYRAAELTGLALL